MRAEAETKAMGRDQGTGSKQTHKSSQGGGSSIIVSVRDKTHTPGQAIEHYPRSRGIPGVHRYRLCPGHVFGLGRPGSWPHVPLGMEPVFPEERPLTRVWVEPTSPTPAAGWALDPDQTSCSLPGYWGLRWLAASLRYLAATLLTWLEKEQAESSSSEMQERQ